MKTKDLNEFDDDIEENEQGEKIDLAEEESDKEEEDGPSAYLITNLEV